MQYKMTLKEYLRIPYMTYAELCFLHKDIYGELPDKNLNETRLRYKVGEVYEKENFNKINKC